MQTTPPIALKLLGVIAIAVLAFGILQACRTAAYGGAAGSEPVAISFTITEPVKVTPEQRVTFLRALKEYSDPASTLIKQNGRVIWPPKGLKINTDRVTLGDPSERRPLKAGNWFLTNWTYRANAVGSLQHTYYNYAAKNTYLPTDQFTGSVRSTQFIGFENEAKMKAFLRELSK